MRPPGPRAGWLVVVVLLGCAFCLSCRMEIRGNTVPPRADGARSVLASLFGESRLALGNSFYEKADSYFHRGIPHRKDRAFDRNVFLELRKQIAPEGHHHIAGGDVEEMMPWLWLALRANPGDIETYLVTAFWLAGDGGRVDKAHEVLDEAQRNIPYAYEVQLEKGRLFLREQRLHEAQAAFDAGLAFWRHNRPEGDDARHDYASLLLYRALLCEAEGRRDDAIGCLEEIMAVFPERTYMQDRIDTLRRGDKPAFAASTVWANLLAADEKARHEAVCPFDDEHAHGHDDDHDDEGR